MNLFFQCLGISGVILLFYGFLTFAITQVSSLFFWFLMTSGVCLLAAFIVKSLTKQWQSLVLALVGLNGLWILAAISKTWVVPGPDLWKVLVPALLCAAAIGGALVRGGNFQPAAVGVAGASIIVGAAAFYLRQKEWANYAILGAAFLLNAALFYLSRIFLRDLFQSRSLRVGTNAAVYTVIMVAIIVVANVFSTDLNKSWDLTENKVNSLTEQSVQILEGLKEPLSIFAFFDNRNPQKPAAKELLGLYSAKSSKVTVKFVDADTEKQLAEKYQAADGSIVVDHAGQTNITQNVTEEGVTQAILKVTRNTSRKLCFTTGHGEYPMDGQDDDTRSYSAVRGGLENEGYEVVSLETLGTPIPADCSSVLVLGPRQAFTEAEAKILETYLSGGGSALLLMEPETPDYRLASAKSGLLPTGLETLLAGYGVELGQNVIVQKTLQLFQGVRLGLTVSTAEYGEHAITQPLKQGRQTVFQKARSVRKASTSSEGVQDLVSSLGQGASWAETDVALLFQQGQAVQDAKDIAGPVSLGVAVEKSGEKPIKLVVLGDADFASNGMVRSFEFNFDFFINAINWLGGDTENISIRPKQLRSSTIELTPEEANSIFYLAIITLPMLVLIFGMDLWWWRRQRG